MPGERRASLTQVAQTGYERFGVDEVVTRTRSAVELYVKWTHGFTGVDVRRAPVNDGRATLAFDGQRTGPSASI
jgi:hypothetical protein